MKHICVEHFVKTPSCRSCVPTFDPSRPKTVPEEMKLGEDDSGEAQSRISPEQLVCQQISSSSQVRPSFSILERLLSQPMHFKY